jgi:hypothetical protein
MWTFLAGPFLSFLPRRWRERLTFSRKINWRAAAFISGMIEGFLAFIALTYWYSYSVGGWAGSAVFTAERRGAVIPENAEGFAGLALVAMHPLTWLIVATAVEALVRVCGAAFTGEALGTLPLYVVGSIVGRGHSERRPRSGAVASPTGAKFPFRELREKYLASRLPEVPDELCFTHDTQGQLLEIRSCRPKSNWEVPCTVSYAGDFYRLELARQGDRPRPFIFFLRRQGAGVLSRTARVYSPNVRPITTSR